MRRYLIGFAGWFTLVLGVAALLTWFVDPYDYWGMPRLPGISRYRPEASRHLDAAKHAQYLRLRPRTLLAGNSRVEVGIDPASPVWPAAMRPVYNFGQPGEGLVANVDAIIAASEAHRPDTILLGVDFPDFRVAQADWRAPYLAGTPTSYRAGFSERWSMLLSLDAVEDAIATIAGQHAHYPGDLTAQGFDGLADYRAQVAAEGHAALFREKDAELLERWRTQPRHVAWPGPGANSNWAALDRLARYARSRGIALRLFTYPYHEDILLLITRAGLAVEYLRWRAELGAFADRTGVPILDFTTVDEATTEAVPPDGDTLTSMRWYWEAGHFKAALGDRMIPALAGMRTANRVGAAVEPHVSEALLREADEAGARSGAVARLRELDGPFE